MSELIATTVERLEVSETLRVAMLTTGAIVLALAFLALLVSDQVQAAGV